MKYAFLLLSLLFTISISLSAEAELVGLWAFDEGAGDVAGDQSGKGKCIICGKESPGRVVLAKAY